MLSEPPRRTKLTQVNTFDDVIRLIKSSSKILVLTGAGVGLFLVISFYGCCMQQRLYIFLQAIYECVLRSLLSYNLNESFIKKVSVSCGIPDFRSRDGVYARLAVDFPDLPNPEVCFVK